MVTDERQVTLPPDLPAGQYTLVVGLYDLSTGQRVGREYNLGDVEVRE